ncbi:hypothetical protein ASD62_06880 [Phycicoccus sp. Root563]|uniref:lipase chaperone n=1 Tax=unclassified Phycicoccus TaxID=2637926 RepID=UPI00070387E6|nr:MULTISPECIES: lipase chaperone [unclassified Phycicoccus]KQZ89069.1 hypothetical protein ASD62_06880 [Phycicoccus sp. Root563]
MTRFQHPRPSHGVRATVGIAAIAVALAGCSSGSGTSGSSSTTGGSSSTAAATSTSAASSGGDPTSSTSSTSPPTTTTSSAGDLPAGAKQLSVTVTGKKVSPSPGVVELRVGQVLRLTVTSDHADELHAHGFEKEAELVAGTATTLDLVTDQPGTYEVETHHPALRLLKVQVR